MAEIKAVSSFLIKICAVSFILWDGRKGAKVNGEEHILEKYIPVVVIKELSETDKILTALKNNGINCAEITFRTSCAKEAIEYAIKNYPEMSIGAGTVINAE